MDKTTKTPADGSPVGTIQSLSNLFHSANLGVSSVTAMDKTTEPPADGSPVRINPTIQSLSNHYCPVYLSILGIEHGIEHR